MLIKRSFKKVVLVCGITDKRKKVGAPCKNRTCDTRFRKPVLYPTELRGLPGQEILYNKSEQKMKT